MTRDNFGDLLLGVCIGLAAVIMLCSCAAAPAVPSCTPLKSAYPHTTLEQKVLADELPNDGPTTQSWIAEYVGIRTSGALLCPPPGK
ncbi:MAG TPA: hypothetical protein VNX86_04840 [Rhizomicrobium sp.]|jgi:hypothetical protein|nr:hypothetical protein [Rhizomicrobium sp.]